MHAARAQSGRQARVVEGPETPKSPEFLKGFSELARKFELLTCDYDEKPEHNTTLNRDASAKKKWVPSVRRGHQLDLVLLSSGPKLRL